jgi:hypothetical protein
LFLPATLQKPRRSVFLDDTTVSHPWAAAANSIGRNGRCHFIVNFSGTPIS